jgi:hypothetical protein
MNRLAIPLYYALPIWAFFATIGVSTLIADANALSPKHGGLAFSSLYFGFVSMIPTALIAAQRPNARPGRKEARRAFGCGVGGTVAILISYAFSQVFPFPAVSVTVLMVIVFVVLIGIPFYLQSRLKRNTLLPH